MCSGLERSDPVWWGGVGYVGLGAFWKHMLGYGMAWRGTAVSVWSGLLGLHGFRHGGLGAFRSGTARSGESRRSWSVAVRPDWAGSVVAVLVRSGAVGYVPFGHGVARIGMAV